MSDYNNTLAALIMERFQPSCAAYAEKTKNGYARKAILLTTGRVAKHLDGSAPAVAVYPIKPASDKVKFAILDIDNHENVLSWEEMVAKSKKIAQSLKEHRLAYLCMKSGGGSGIHFAVLLKKPLPAKKVRRLMRKVIKACGYHEAGKGGGIAAGEVEIFPKQDSVKKGGYGSAVALPFARASVPLDENFQPLTKADALNALENTPDCELPDDESEETDPEDDDPTPSAPALPPLEVANVVRGIQEGNRDNAIFALICQLRRSGIPKELTLKLACEAAGRCSPPFNREVATEKVERLYSDEIQVTKHTDIGNGELFRDLFSAITRYDYVRKKWLIFTGQFWEIDHTGEIYRLVKEMTHFIMMKSYELADVDKDLSDATAKFARKSQDHNRVNACLKQARTEEPIADDGKWWNYDPMLFAVANGVIELNTGAIRGGRPEDKITQHSCVSYDPKAEAPRWRQFLLEIFDNQQELVDFVHRAVGYSLTGLTREEVLFITYGSGANGKTKFINVLRQLFGDYYSNTPFSTLEAMSRSGIPNDVAALRGKRLVSSSESNERATLNEARIKALTGGDPITARFLYGEHFTFMPVCKFWLATNHKPRVEDDSHGFWRRVLLIPFNVSFTGDKVDKELEKKLAAELPGILNWAIEGCLTYQKEGLKPPAIVVEATKEYRAENDQLSAFIDTCCIIKEGLTCRASELYREYVNYCKQQRMEQSHTLTQTMFGRRMGAMFEKDKDSNGTFYRDIGILDERDRDSPLA